MKEEMMPMKEEMMPQLPKKAMALVVGAGPTGIAALRSLKDVGTVVCVDARDSIGGALCHAYKGFSLTATDKICVTLTPTSTSEIMRMVDTQRHHGMLNTLRIMWRKRI